MNITRTDTTLTLDLKQSFNRYTLSYTASVPLRCTLTYTEQGTHGAGEHTEEFFLEAGEHMRFSSYTDGYLRHLQADTLLSVTLRTIAHDGGEFVLHDLTVDVCPVPAEKTYYFENERYRVGVELCWGGGLSYLCDKKCPVDGLENMLNHFDTGRLIQQSYYGTAQPPYVCGEFMNQRWCYNPVQGGDRGNHKSKLIEARVSEDEVYVKCRPRDWGHDGGTTYAYMENWYRLEGDYLVVDNRFVDFSGWEHPLNNQEVPAFYTVSYLNNYYWYDGDQPWTDAPLSVRSDLPFWPDDWPYCTFRPKKGNTETWSAFVDDGGYGLGLYTPNIYHTIAGRHMYDASKDPNAISCNYIAPVSLVQLRCFDALTYSYLITAGQLNDIRAAFKARKDDITNQTFDDY